jgi:hypothetical protein
MPVSPTQPPVDIRCRPFNFGSFPVLATTTGTDTAGSATGVTLFYASIWIPGQCSITGIKYLIGSVGGTDTVIASLHSLDGTLLATSATAGTTVGTTATTQSLALTNGAYNFPGPAHALIGLTFSGNTARFRTIPAVFDAGSNPMTGSVTVVANTPATFSPSATTFTADKGPIGSVY